MARNDFAIMLADNKLGDFPADQQLAEIERQGHFQVGLYASMKLDGIRAVVRGGKVLSRTLIPIRSKFVQDMFSHLEGFDGELVCGEPTSLTCYTDTYSAVMTQDCTTPVTYHVFDSWLSTGPYSERLAGIRDMDWDLEPEMIRVLDQQLIHTVEGAETIESMAVERNYEGLILRRPDAPYKFGRSTLKQGYLIKLKRLLDSEGEIIGFEELMRNGNEDVRSNLGYAKRSSALAGLVPGGTLGALVCRDKVKFPGVDSFKVGVFKGYDKAQLQAIWDDKERFLGQFVKYRYVVYGAKDRPRHPRGVGFRHVEDM